MVLPPVPGDGGNVHLPGVPSPPSSSNSLGSDSAGAAWETVEPEAVPRIPLQDLPLGFCFRFQCHQDLGIPTPTSTPGPKTIEALPSRFVSAEPTVVSLETMTQKSSQRDRKDICATWFSTDPACGRGVICPHCTRSPCPDASGDKDRDESSIKCCSNHCMSGVWGGPV